jgi:hypothetical protein
MLFGITTESCSASERNRVHLRPDSPHTGATIQLSLLLCVIYMADRAAIRLWEIVGRGSEADRPAEAGDEALQELLQRRFDELDLLVIHIDGMVFGEHHVISLAARGVSLDSWAESFWGIQQPSRLELCEHFRFAPADFLD